MYLVFPAFLASSMAATVSSIGLPRTVSTALQLYTSVHVAYTVLSILCTIHTSGVTPPSRLIDASIASAAYSFEPVPQR